MNGSADGARSRSDLAALCSQQASRFIALPAQRVERVVQPTAQQQRTAPTGRLAPPPVEGRGNSSRPSISEEAEGRFGGSRRRRAINGQRDFNKAERSNASSAGGDVRNFLTSVRTGAGARQPLGAKDVRKFLTSPSALTDRINIIG